jgi:PBSX family phage terminase large subunit
MVWAFVDWAMRNFSGQRFGICAKTVGSAKKNIIMPFMAMSAAKQRYTMRWRQSENELVIRRGYTMNTFEVFGGKDESSFMLIQGRTLAGILLDEVVLMPQSFVNQALARCSVNGARIWFSCNPDSPGHWFYNEWIKRSAEHNALYLHFAMTDNPSLSPETLERYANMYPSGVFYDRYVLGKWVMAEGMIYPGYADAIAEPPENENPSEYCLSVDYGTMNAFAALLWAKYGAVWYAVREYYYSGRTEGEQKTDEDYANDLDKWCADIETDGRLLTIIDPSAASFITLLRKRDRYKVMKAKNAVLDGIRETANALSNGYIYISPDCKKWRWEAEGYVWNDKSQVDEPIKVNDHLMDSTRYFVNTMYIVRKALRREDVLYIPGSY